MLLPTTEGAEISGQAPENLADVHRRAVARRLATGVIVEPERIGVSAATGGAAHLKVAEIPEAVGRTGDRGRAARAARVRPARAEVAVDDGDPEVGIAPV